MVSTIDNPSRRRASAISGDSVGVGCGSGGEGAAKKVSTSVSEQSKGAEMSGASEQSNGAALNVLSNYVSEHSKGAEMSGAEMSGSLYCFVFMFCTMDRAWISLSRSKRPSSKRESALAGMPSMSESWLTGEETRDEAVISTERLSNQSHMASVMSKLMKTKLK